MTVPSTFTVATPLGPLDQLRIRAPDGSLYPIGGIVVQPGQSIREALEDFIAARPGYSIVTLQPCSAG